jgi:hypothetical protein
MYHVTNITPNLWMEKVLVKYIFAREILLIINDYQIFNIVSAGIL